MTLETFVQNQILPLFAGAINLMMVLAVLGFIVGIIVFMQGAADDQRRALGKRWIVWSLISLFLMVTVWGIARLIRFTLFNI